MKIVELREKNIDELRFIADDLRSGIHQKRMEVAMNTAGDHGVFSDSGNGCPFGGLLPADGNADGFIAERTWSVAARRPPVHLLLRHDVDGDAAGGASRIRQCIDCSGADDEDVVAL